MMLSHTAVLVQGQVGRLHKSCPQTTTEAQQEETAKASKLHLQLLALAEFKTSESSAALSYCLGGKGA